MRANMVALALALVLPVVAFGQTEAIQKEIDAKLEEIRKKGKELTLDELLQEALKQNPDIRLAESRLREAEALLNKVRLETLQKVVIAHQNIAAARATFEEAKKRFERVRELHNRKVVAGEELEAAQLTMQKYKAELAKAEAELPLLVGQGPSDFKDKTALNRWLGLRTDDRPEFIRRVYLDLQGRLPTVEEMGAILKDPAKLREVVTPGKAERVGKEQGDKLRAFLNSPIKAEFDGISPKDVIDYVRDATRKTVNVHITYAFADGKVRLNLSDPVPVGALFQWFEDNFPVRVVWRDYGILIVDRNEVPAGAVSIFQIWKGDEGGVRGK